MLLFILGILIALLIIISRFLYRKLTQSKNLLKKLFYCPIWLLCNLLILFLTLGVTYSMVIDYYCSHSLTWDNTEFCEDHRPESPADFGAMRYNLE